MNIRGERGCNDESKRFGETLTVAYERRYDLDVRTARIFNTYSPRMRPNDGRAIPNLLSQTLRDEGLTIYGDGSQTRSFCCVDDLIQGLRSLMNTDGLQGEAIKLGMENEITIQTLADTVVDICEADSEFVYEPLPEDDPRKRKPDISKARRLLEWEPEVPLEEGLQLRLGYFRSHERLTPDTPTSPGADV